MGQPGRFWDRIADRYAAKPVTDEAVYQEKLQITRGYLGPDMEVLEFGCGTGSTALVHAPYVKHIRAIDISRRMIEIAQDKAKAGKVENVRFEQRTIEELSAPKESYDAVLGLSILHLLEDRDAALAKVYRLLKPGGYFVTSTPCLGETMKWFKLVGPIGRFLGLMPLVRVFTEAELAEAITRTGFAIEHQWRPSEGKAKLGVFIVARKPAA